MFLTENISTTKHGMKKGRREGREERTHERSPFIHIYVTHINKS